MSSHVSGAIGLVEQIYEDRGKVSALGIGWNVVRAGHRNLRFIAILDVDTSIEEAQIDVEFQLREADDDGEQLRSTEASIGFPEKTDDVVVPPAAQVQVPVRWRLELAPETLYRIDAVHDEQIIATAYFYTLDESDELNPDPGVTAES